MSKRKRKSSKKRVEPSKLLSYIALGLSFVSVALATLALGYYIGYGDAKEEFSSKQKHQKTQRLALLKKLENTTTHKDKKSVNTRLKDILQKDVKTSISAAHEIDSSSLGKPPKPPKRTTTIVGAKPKLVIIIDDMSVKSQVEAVKALKLPLTMSFLPPSKARPNSAKLAAKEPFYMVHLPMEAISFTKEEPFTLRVDDSQAKITARIKSVKKLFPRVHYINNHTGSKFTSNERAVNRLIYALNQEHINFIDSRTIGDTKVPKVMKNFGLKYMSRDVFLDHHMDKAYVKKQIRQAIKVAKKYGTAIAIGHPHKNTIMALYESKALLKQVDLVLINKLY